MHFEYLIYIWIMNNKFDNIFISRVYLDSWRILNVQISPAKSWRIHRGILGIYMAMQWCMWNIRRNIQRCILEFLHSVFLGSCIMMTWSRGLPPGIRKTCATVTIRPVWRTMMQTGIKVAGVSIIRYNLNQQHDLLHERARVGVMCILYVVLNQSTSSYASLA